ncbi:MAG: indolepyruvate ferredoxin oxidoreductase [Deltaproteobacteria bacterium]|nr:MAG: indolepyruvate ferredoxin oxidoreductase [Deltaproteobacteria bacterium]
MVGNEAIARGVVEAGVNFSAAYPGSPSSEVQESLCRVADDLGIYVEWSANEIVALEAGAAASMAGLRAVAIMKQNGVNVASDFILTHNLVGSPGGLVLVVCDDPGGLSSTNEIDTRNYARFADLPLLEPASAQEAKDMSRWAFELSEELKLMVILRSVTRISHARSIVTLGRISRRRPKALVKPGERYVSLPSTPEHNKLHEKIERAQEIFERSPFNCYFGPRDARLLIITCGTGWYYSREALKILNLEKKVGILKLGTTWPLPEKLIIKHLRHAKEVLIVEEVDPFLEMNIKTIAAEQAGSRVRIKRFYGKRSGHIRGDFRPGVGENNPDIVVRALSKITGIKDPRPKRTRKLPDIEIPRREVAFCPGCPHRASFWIVKNALPLDDRGGFLVGDIGCYSLGTGRTGYYLSRTMHCMGSSLGIASGFGKLDRFEFDQPVVVVVGDSTFYHACAAGLFNAVYNRSRFTCIVLDNSATAMTGFQPHPGTGQDALGAPAPVVSVEAICRGLGIEPRVCDPFEIEQSLNTLRELMEEDGLNVLIYKRTCALLSIRRGEGREERVFVDQYKCIGDDCGCARYCQRFGCPALIWDGKNGVAVVDEVVCTKCQACLQICPKGAIKVEEG